MSDNLYATLYRDQRVKLLALLGFASGLPLLLSGGTLSAWLYDEGIRMRDIGLAALIQIPYNVKILWAPLLDRYAPKFLGRRRGWLFLTQMGLVAAICGLGLMNPREALIGTALAALFVTFLSASQDIVSDAYRTDILPEEERGPGAATFVSGYRIGMLMAGSAALFLSDYMPWSTVYFIMGGLMMIGVVATLRAPPAVALNPPTNLKDAVVEPLRDFFSRRGAVMILLFVMFYKFGDAIAGQLITPFLLDVGDPISSHLANPDSCDVLGQCWDRFTKTEIGLLGKTLGMTMTIIGAVWGGGMVSRRGLRWALVAFGIAQAGANLLYMALAFAGKDYFLLVSAVGVDNLCGGFGTAAFVAYLMSLCNRNFSVTQYALLTSAASLFGRLLSAFGGYAQEAIGWAGFFGFTILFAAPGLLLLLYLIPNPNELLPPIAELDRG